MRGPHRDDSLRVGRPASSEDNTSTAEHSDRRLPRVPGYRVLKLLGKGAMGEVFLAEEERLERLVALKLLAEEAVSQGEARARFEREAKAMATVEHRHVVRIYAFGEVSGEHHPRPFLAMEYVEGETLDDRLLREGRLPLADGLRIARQTVEALQAAWQKRIVHRDVKPGNILLDTEGSVRVGDFGIAKATAVEEESTTATGTSLGTPLYVSPEQALGKTLDFRADVYSLGVVLWEMLAGRRPFEETNPYLLIGHHIRDPLPRLADAGISVPAAVEELVARITEKDAFARCNSHQHLLTLFDEVATSAGGGSEAPAVTESQPGRYGIDAALLNLAPRGQSPKVFEEMMHLGRDDSPQATTENLHVEVQAPSPPSVPQEATERRSRGEEDRDAEEQPAGRSSKISPAPPPETPSGAADSSAAVAAAGTGTAREGAEPSDPEQAERARRARAGLAGDLDLGDLDLKAEKREGHPPAKGESEEHLTPLQLDGTATGAGGEPRRSAPRGGRASAPAASAAGDAPSPAGGDDSLDDLLGVLEQRRSDSRLQRQRQEMERAALRQRFDRLKEEVVKPALRQLMVRLHSQGHPTRLQDLGRGGLRFEFVLDSSPVVRCHLEVEVNDRGRVVLRFLENLGVVAEEQLAPNEVTAKLLGQRIVAFLGRKRR